MGTGKLWISILVFCRAVWDIERCGIRNIIPLYLKYIFCARNAGASDYFFYDRQKKWEKEACRSVCQCIVSVSRLCGGVEPEKRMYPLALGADITEGKYLLT